MADCVVCKTNIINSVYLCGHACCCLECAELIGPQCPYCRQNKNYTKLYLELDTDGQNLVKIREKLHQITNQLYSKTVEAESLHLKVDNLQKLCNWRLACNKGKNAKIHLADLNKFNCKVFSDYLNNFKYMRPGWSPYSSILNPEYDRNLKNFSNYVIRILCKEGVYYQPCGLTDLKRGDTVFLCDHQTIIQGQYCSDQISGKPILREGHYIWNGSDNLNRPGGLILDLLWRRLRV